MKPAQILQGLGPYLRWMRLDQPADLMLLIWPLLWASFAATSGAPSMAALLLLALASLALRCAAWLFNDLMESRLLRIAPESYVAAGELSPRRVLEMIAVLLLLGLLLLAPLPIEVWYFAPAALVAPLLFPFLKRRSYLVQLLLAAGSAWVVPMAYAAQGVLPGKAGWLLYVVALCWGLSGQLLQAAPRAEREQKVGVHSMAQLFGPLTLFWVFGLQLGGLVALLLIGQQLELGVFHAIGLAAALGLSAHQLWLLYPGLEGVAARVYRLNHWWGLAVFCALFFPYLCGCGLPSP